MPFAEVIGQRTATRKRFKRRIRSRKIFRDEYHAGPVHYQKDGLWHVPDTVIRPGHGVIIGENLDNMFATKVLKSGGYRVESDDEWIEFLPIGLAQPIRITVSGSEATIVDAWPDTDLTLRINPGQVKEMITLKGPNSPVIYEWQVDVSDPSMTSGMTQPYAWYVGGDEEEIEVPWEWDDDIYRIALAERPSRYPVVIDPTYQVAASIDDAAARNTGAGGNMYNLVNLKFGCIKPFAVALNQWNFLRWDISIPDGMIIDSAKIQYCAFALGTVLFDTWIARLFEDGMWDATGATEGFHTDNYATGYALLNIGHDSDDKVDWSVESWPTAELWYDTPDLSAMVQEFIDKSDYIPEGDWFGVRVNGEDPGCVTWSHNRNPYSYDRNSAKAPKLIIEYSEPAGSYGYIM